jgi:spermidine synthase
MKVQTLPVLKLAIFATGLAGIVAEYAMCTLASYLLGNAVLQWSMVISLMLFAMGLGSRFTRRLEQNLTETLVVVELLLTVCTAVAVPISYLLSVWINPLEFVIYGFAMAIGFLIGLEIPLVARLNEQFEALKENISGVMEYDYFGALLGGLLFAWVGLPLIGLAHTPLILATVNFLVALLLFYTFGDRLSFRPWLKTAALVTGTLLVVAYGTVTPIVQYGEQRKYKDTVVYSESSPYQNIALTRWKDDYWLYLNGSEQFSTFDEHLYHEPLVHPAMLLHGAVKNVLILGGGDGLAARELLKYDALSSIVVVDLDPAVTRLAKEHPVLLKANQGSFHHPKVTLIHQDAFQYLSDAPVVLVDLIIVDLPDPKSVDLARLYSLSFYRMAYQRLTPGGILVTQATSPFFSRLAFLCIAATVEAAGFAVVPLHNQIPTMGEWGWVLGQKEPVIHDMRAELLAQDYEGVPTKFLTQEANALLFHFGKSEGETAVEINSLNHLILHRYYHSGRWDLY